MVGATSRGACHPAVSAADLQHIGRQAGRQACQAANPGCMPSCQVRTCSGDRGQVGQGEVPAHTLASQVQVQDVRARQHHRLGILVLQRPAPSVRTGAAPCPQRTPVCACGSLWCWGLPQHGTCNCCAAGWLAPCTARPAVRRHPLHAACNGSSATGPPTTLTVTLNPEPRILHHPSPSVAATATDRPAFAQHATPLPCTPMRPAPHTSIAPVQVNVPAGSR